MDELLQKSILTTSCGSLVFQRYLYSAIIDLKARKIAIKEHEALERPYYNKSCFDIGKQGSAICCFR